MTPPPDPGALLDRLEALCADDTTTGREDRGIGELRHQLEALGGTVELQRVEQERHNVLACWSDRPRILFSTHLDTVPPYLPPHRDGDTLHGRGACDAKGQIISQLAAIATLLAAGMRDVAWLGVVGEETDSIGAQKALLLRDRCQHLRSVVDGEPTENVLATGQRGSQQIRLTTHGVPAHSGNPELGRSAIWELFDWLARLRALPVRTDAELGPEIWNLGTVRGGEAPNIVPANATAEVFVRALDGCAFADTARSLAPAGATVELIASTPADRYPALPGFRHATVPFGSDAPRLRRLAPSGTVVLAGPGSIRLAHTAEERITGAELVAGVDLLVAVARHVIA